MISFEDWRKQLSETGDICPVRLGMLRSDLAELWEEPTDTSVACKGDVPLILKYGDIEFHFDPGPDGPLFLIYRDTDDEGIVELCIHRNR